MWSNFVTTWNSTITRRPQNVLSTFLATQSLSWLGLFSAYSGLAIGVIPPELAIGMVVSKFSSKFRQPVNLAMAAGIVKVAPTIATVKVTPLITGFVADEKSSVEFSKKRKTLEESYPFMKSSIGNVEKAAIWIQGPIDKYGLALFLSGRASGAMTVLSVTFLAQHGFDIPALLSDYGLGGSALSASVSKALIIPPLPHICSLSRLTSSYFYVFSNVPHVGGGAGGCICNKFIIHTWSFLARCPWN